MIEFDLQYFGGRGSSGGKATEAAMTVANEKVTLTKKAESQYETRNAEDMKQEERAYIQRDITRTNLYGDSAEIHSAIAQAPIGTVLSYEKKNGSKETFVKTSQDSWDRTFKHRRGFEHLDTNEAERLSTRQVSTRMYEGRLYEDIQYDVRFRKLKK